MKEILHFNGDIYEVLGITVNTVTDENLVVCRKVQDPVGIIWEQPEQKRFERMDAEYVPETNDGDTISRKAAIEALDKCYCGGKDENGRPWIYKENAVEAIEMVEPLPPAEPKRETATVSVGISKGGVTMWYECDACGEPVDQGDTFCSGCGRELIHE